MRSAGLIVAFTVAVVGPVMSSAAHAEGDRSAASAAGPTETPAIVSFTRPQLGELKTRPGNEISLSLGKYTYFELAGTGGRIMDLTGPKIGIEYTRTQPLSEKYHWFAIVNLRGSRGKVRYSTPQSYFVDTVPDASSPSGYVIVSRPGPPLREGGIDDWYVEGRALIAKDFVRSKVAVSPYAGIGFRHLSNGKGPYSSLNSSGARINDYFYVPLGVTLRTNKLLGRWLNSAEFNFEGNALVQGWQTTRYSRIPPFDVPASATSPAFAFLGTNDLQFRQRLGYGLRVSAKLHFKRRWSLEPFLNHWGVFQSVPDVATFRYMVNGQSAQTSVFYTEPMNQTNELGLKVGFHF